MGKRGSAEESIKKIRRKTLYKSQVQWGGSRKTALRCKT